LLSHQIDNIWTYFWISATCFTYLKNLIILIVKGGRKFSIFSFSCKEFTLVAIVIVVVRQNMLFVSFFFRSFFPLFKRFNEALFSHDLIFSSFFSSSECAELSYTLSIVGKDQPDWSWVALHLGSIAWILSKNSNLRYLSVPSVPLGKFLQCLQLLLISSVLLVPLKPSVPLVVSSEDLVMVEPSVLTFKCSVPSVPFSIFSIFRKVPQCLQLVLIPLVLLVP